MDGRIHGDAAVNERRMHGWDAAGYIIAPHMAY